MAFFNSFVDPQLLDRLNNVLNSDFGVITYTEAIESLEPSQGAVRVSGVLGL